MSLRAAALLLSALVLPAVPGTAAAQGPPSDPACTAPTLEGFLPSEPPRSERPERLRVVAPGAATVTVAWPDQTTSTAGVRDDVATFRTSFTRPGVKRIVATATALCGARTSGALNLRVHAPCERARDASLGEEDCDEVRGELVAEQAGVATVGTWLDSPCRDVIMPQLPTPPEPVARAADCVLPTNPTGVVGRLPVVRGKRVLLTLGAPARRMRVALGDSLERRTRYVRARPVGRTGRVWSVRVGRLGRSTLLYVVARRARGTNEWVVGVRRR